MDLMQQLAGIPVISSLMPYITATIALAAIAARFLPPPAASMRGIYPVVYSVVNWLAQNGGYAINAKAPGARQSTSSAKRSR